MHYKIAPSILSADFGKLNEEITLIEDYVDLFHIDVMDGHFVPNISFGVPVMQWIKSNKPLDVHLMIENPRRYVESFIKAGGERIIIHVEASDDLKGDLEMIDKLGARPAVSLNPGTKIDKIIEVLPLVDEVLVMTVEPGFGGQSFMPEVLWKIEELRARGFKEDIGVDGGINEETAVEAVKAGANLLVAGSYIYGAVDRFQQINKLRKIFER